MPNSMAVLVLGIVSISLCWLGFGIVGSISGITAISISGKAFRPHKENSSRFTLNSYNNLKAGKICAIIGLGISAFFLFCALAFVLSYGGKW